MVNDDGYCVVNDGYSNNNLVGGKTTILKKYIHICISISFIFVISLPAYLLYISFFNHYIRSYPLQYIHLYALYPCLSYTEKHTHVISYSLHP